MYDSFILSSNRKMSTPKKDTLSQLDEAIKLGASGVAFLDEAVAVFGTWVPPKSAATLRALHATFSNKWRDDYNANVKDPSGDALVNAFSIGAKAGVGLALYRALEVYQRKLSAEFADQKAATPGEVKWVAPVIGDNVLSYADSRTEEWKFDAKHVTVAGREDLGRLVFDAYIFCVAKVPKVKTMDGLLTELVEALSNGVERRPRDQVPKNMVKARNDYEPKDATQALPMVPFVSPMVPKSTPPPAMAAPQAPPPALDLLPAVPGPRAPARPKLPAAPPPGVWLVGYDYISMLFKLLGNEFDERPLVVLSTLLIDKLEQNSSEWTGTFEFYVKLGSLKAALEEFQTFDRVPESAWVFLSAWAEGMAKVTDNKSALEATGKVLDDVNGLTRRVLAHMKDLAQHVRDQQKVRPFVAVVKPRPVVKEPADVVVQLEEAVDPGAPLRVAVELTPARSALNPRWVSLVWSRAYVLDEGEFNAGFDVHRPRKEAWVGVPEARPVALQEAPPMARPMAQ